MPQSRGTNADPFKVPAHVDQTIRAPGGGTVEVTVEEDAIWVSNVDAGGTILFTLRIARKALESHPNAVRGIEDRASHAKTLSTRTPRHARDEECAQEVAKSKTAGFWYVDTRYKMLGTPVTVIDG